MHSSVSQVGLSSPRTYISGSSATIGLAPCWLQPSTPNCFVSRRNISPPAVTMPKQKPLILYCCTPMTGHLMPNLQIAADLVRRGYDVTFLGAPTCRDKIEAAGCRYATHIGLAVYCVEGMSQFVQAYPEMLTMNRNDLEPAEILNRIVEMTTVNLVPSQLESARIAAAAMHAREPEREIILVCDSWWWGIIPLKLGQSLLAPFVKGNDQELQPPVKSLGISVIPAMFSSIDSGPGFGALGYE